MSIEGIFPSTANRRNFLKGAGMTGIGLAGAAAIATNLASPAQRVMAAGVTDVDILNFALNLEFLEAEFYSVATTGKTLAQMGVVKPAQMSGPTTGGKLIKGLTTTSPESYLSSGLRVNEINHVALLRKSLGAMAVLKPTINLDALGYGFGSVDEFLKLARQLEDTGTSAYLGAAPLITNPAYLAVAGSILSVEAKHSGALRFACIQNGVDSPEVDSLDFAPNVEHPFGNPVQGLTVARTTTQVLSIVYGGSAPGGFFPNGLNGTIK